MNNRLASFSIFGKPAQTLMEHFLEYSLVPLLEASEITKK